MDLRDFVLMVGFAQFAAIICILAAVVVWNGNRRLADLDERINRIATEAAEKAVERACRESPQYFDCGRITRR